MTWRKLLDALLKEGHRRGPQPLHHTCRESYGAWDETRLFNVYWGQYRTRGEGGCHQVLSFSMTMPDLMSSVRQTRDLLQHFGWELFDHLPYSADLAPSDFHLSCHTKQWLGGQRFGGNKELKTSVMEWLRTQAAAFFGEGIQDFVSMGHIRSSTLLLSFPSNTINV